MSISKLAQLHGVNANLVFTGRHELRAGLFGVTPPASLKLLLIVLQGAPEAPLRRATPHF